MADAVKHTPGEWIANGDQVEVQSAHNDGYRICDVFGPDYKANARLIAAAPELLDALKEAMLALDGFAKGEGVFKPIEQTIVMARDSIAKAEGRTHA